MKNNILNLIFITIIIVFVVSLIIPNNSFAVDTGLGDLDQYRGDGTEGQSAKLDSMINTAITVIQIVGSMISVIVLIAIGIRYMFSSIEEKAEYKETMMPYIIGAFILFGISNVVGFMNFLAKSLF